MTVTSSNLNFVLDEVVSAVVFDRFYSSTDFMFPQLYSINPSSKRRERSASIGSLGMWDVKNEGQAVADDTVSQQFEKDFVHFSRGKSLPFSREMIDDEEWGTVQKLSSDIGRTGAQSMEIDGAALFNDAFVGATYKSEDNKSICNDAHTNKDGGNSQDNSFALSLTTANIDTIRVAMKGWTNYRGDKILIRPKALLVPDALEMTAWELVRSQLRPNTAENNGNFYNGALELMVWSFLTDTNAWFLIDTDLATDNLKWYQRVGLETFGDGNLYTGTRKVGGYVRYSFGCIDWRWIAGSNPS